MHGGAFLPGRSGHSSRSGSAKAGFDATVNARGAAMRHRAQHDVTFEKWFFVRAMDDRTIAHWPRSAAYADEGSWLARGVQSGKNLVQKPNLANCASRPVLTP